MAKLDANNIRIFKSLADNLYSDAYMLSDEYDCAYCAAEMDPTELMIRKYRIASCVKALSELPLDIYLSDLYLPDIDKMFLSYDGNRDYYAFESSEWLCYLENTLNEFIEFGELYLDRCLSNTNWQVYFVSEVDEYVHFSKELILHIKDSIEAHWRSTDDTQIEETTKSYLTSVGLTNQGYEDLYAAYNLILVNEKISKVIKICKKQKEYKEWNEYKELSSVSRFYLIDRYFPMFSSKDICESEGVCINYMVGEVYSDRAEECGMYQLNYEAVLYLILADLYAELFLKRFEIEVGESL